MKELYAGLLLTLVITVLVISRTDGGIRILPRIVPRFSSRRAVLVAAPVYPTRRVVLVPSPLYASRRVVLVPSPLYASRRVVLVPSTYPIVGKRDAGIDQVQTINKREKYTTI